MSADDKGAIRSRRCAAAPGFRTRALAATANHFAREITRRTPPQFHDLKHQQFRHLAPSLHLACTQASRCSSQVRKAHQLTIAEP